VTPTTAELRERVVALIRDALFIEVPSDDADLVALGLLDSLAIVTLIGELELAFGVELPLDDFDVEDFRTVERIAAFLAGALPSTGAA
jgi:D-alanine--poly(phosphoribitol) ligase subunit 2